MINSMTKAERSHPELFVVEKDDGDGKNKREEFHLDRVRRVSSGSGRKESEVKELINKFATMKGMMLQLGAQSGLLGKIPGLKQLSQMKQLAGMDMDKLMEVAGMKPPEPERKKFRPPVSSQARAKAKRKRKLQRQSRKRKK